MRRPAAIVLVAALVLVVACSDDATGPGTSFDLTVRVVDQEGNRVRGLDLMVLMDSPYYQDGRAAEKAAVSIGFIVPVTSHATLTVEDAAGGHVRTLVDDVLPAGVHRVMWDGHGEDRVHCYSGLYYARMVGRDPAGAVAFDERQPMYMALMDFDRATLGATDENGEIVLTDRRLFPVLYGDVQMQARDENGDPLGAFPLTHTMRFYLRDARYGHVERVDRAVINDDEVLVLPWMGVDGAAAAAAPAVRPGAARAGQPPESGFVLQAPYPNPFN